MATDDAPTADPDELGYAQALAELEEILDALEDDTVDVDRLATQVQRAAELATNLARGIYTLRVAENSQSYTMKFYR
jgi:exodeoxyribonuclease VII small subunit